jgi:hypothetical protein
MDVQTTTERAVDVLAEARESVAPAVDRVADVLEETADRIRSTGNTSGRRFPWRLVVLGVGLVAVGVAVTQARRAAASRQESEPSRFASDLPGEVPADEAQAKVDESVAAAKEAVTDITERARQTAADI